jgi:hypothetical protein
MRERVERHRRADEVPLSVRNLDLPHHVEFFTRFDPLGDDVGVNLAGKADERLRHGATSRIAIDSTAELAVELDEIGSEIGSPALPGN